MGKLLEGKVALVTGAGHGIGRGHALELAAQGAKVVVNDLGGSVNGEGAGRDAEQVVALIEQRGGTAAADFGDVGDEAQVEAMVGRAIERFGKLDIVVNNAGIVRDKAIWNMSASDFDLVVRVHLRGTWLLCRAAARHWRERSQAEGRVAGRIINTTSGAGLSGHFGQTNYAAAKAGIVGLSLTLSLELARVGATVNVIGPGALTRLSATIPGAAKPQEADEFAPDEWNPLDPSISSPLVAWLASDEADHVTGQVFKALRDRIQWLQGWNEIRSISSNGKRWKAAELGQVLATDVFGTRAPGLRLGG
jgi:NAD(P)-dependent dehydrogenase (short-subunit alcohol dehydrogenase family)